MIRDNPSIHPSSVSYLVSVTYPVQGHGEPGSQETRAQGGEHP